MSYTVDLKAVTVTVSDDDVITIVIPPAHIDPANPQEPLSVTITPDQTKRGVEDTLRALGVTLP